MKQIILIVACALFNYDILGMHNKFHETRYEYNINTKKLTNFLQEEYIPRDANDPNSAADSAVNDITYKLINDLNTCKDVISILEQSELEQCELEQSELEQCELEQSEIEQSEIDTDKLSFIFTKCVMPDAPLSAYKYRKLFALMISANKDQCTELAKLLGNPTQNVEEDLTEYFIRYKKGITENINSIKEHITKIDSIQISATDDSKITTLCNILASYCGSHAIFPVHKVLLCEIARDIFDHTSRLCITSTKKDDPET